MKKTGRWLRHSTSGYCAFCRSPRNYFEKKHVGLLDAFLILVFSLFLMFVLWGGFDPKVMIVFVGISGLTEFAVQLKWRLAMVCRHCGFDPILYVNDPVKAAKKVENYLKDMDNSQTGFLRKPKLPAGKKENPRAADGRQAGRQNDNLLTAQPRGKFLSKQI